jgi:hypothetical protein
MVHVRSQVAGFAAFIKEHASAPITIELPEYQVHTRCV